MLFFTSAIKAVASLFEDGPKEEPELSDNPAYDSESAALLSQFRSLGARIGSAPGGGLSMAQYNALLRKEGAGR